MATRAPKASDEPAISLEQYDALREVERRILWLSTLIVHHANNVRPSTEKSKIGGHQASSASVVSIITALYFHFLKRVIACRSSRMPPRPFTLHSICSVISIAHI